MTSGADLFVVCKQCGSEVSPYITECPYCGHRLRRRAPKLPRVQAPSRPARGRSRLGSVLGGRRRRTSAESSASGYAPSYGGRSVGTRPYATIGLVAAGCGVWVAARASPTLRGELAVLGPLHGEWWRLFGNLFVYVNGVYAFATLMTIAIFGWLLERRHGPLVVLALFFGAGALGALAAIAVYPFPVVSGGNAGGLALLAAWAARDLRAARVGDYYEGELLGPAVLAALLLAMPFVIYESSWLAGVTGALLGLLCGLGLSRLPEADL
jgi:hypothetical protein